MCTIKKGKRKIKGRRLVLLIIFIVLILFALAVFLIPRPLMPAKYSEVTCSVMTYNQKQIFPTDEQTKQLAAILEECKVTPTLKQYSEIMGSHVLRVALGIHFYPENKSTQIASVTVFKTREGELLYIAQKTGFPRGIAYRIHNGQQLFEDIEALICEW